MNRKVVDRIDTITANIDDLQSGMEAGRRAAGSLCKTANRMDEAFSAQLKAAQLSGSLVRRARELASCMVDQREALVELRRNMARLRTEIGLRRKLG